MRQFSLATLTKLNFNIFRKEKENKRELYCCSRTWRMVFVNKKTTFKGKVQHEIREKHSYRASFKIYSSDVKQHLLIYGLLSEKNFIKTMSNACHQVVLLLSKFTRLLGVTSISHCAKSKLLGFLSSQNHNLSLRFFI